MMVDIHCHVLPNVDDGSTSWKMSIEMCRMARADGIGHIVATPHANSRYTYDRAAHSATLKELANRVGPELKLSLGCDFHLSYENLLDALDHPERYTIASTNYLLIELSDFSVPPSVSESLQKLLGVGIVPIITHPERNPVLQHNQRQVLNWVEAGCLVQVTANSLTGQWGPRAQEAAVSLIKLDAVHILATDAHGIDSRPPILSKARAIAAKIVGESAADALVRDNPSAVVLPIR